MGLSTDPDRLHGLGTAHIADALTGLALPKRVARPEIKPAFAMSGLVIGRALPVKHVGSVDVFLAAFERVEPGDLLVADNEGRLNEGCIGDLVTAEARHAGLAGIVIDGAHRDTAQLRAIGLPVWSLGAFPYGPTTLRETKDTGVSLGEISITRDDVIAADEDGVLVISAAHLDTVMATAQEIARREEAQRHSMAQGKTLREQLAFRDYQAARALNPALTFRAHIANLKGAIEV